MKTVTKEYKTKVAAKINSLAGKFKLGDIEIAEHNEIIRARIQPWADSLKPGLLIIQKKNDYLLVEIRNVIFCGSRGSLTNRTVNYLVKHLFCPPRQQDDSPEEDQEMLMGLMVDQFTTSRRTVEDLLALVAAATNNLTTFSRAITDAVDGEVYVEGLTESDFDTIPDSLQDLIGGVLMHAELLRRCEHLLRALLVHTAEPPRWWVEALVALSRKKADSEDEDEKSGAAEKEQEVTI